MKREIKNAIMQGIKESELNGYKWSITKNGLKRSCGEEFIFSVKSPYDGSDVKVLTVKAQQSGLTMVSIAVGITFYCDTSDLVDAYRIATECTIRKANHTY